jgi:hypothetical protein
MGVYAPSFDDDVVCEMHGTVQEDIGPDGCSASVQLMCPWALRHAVARDLLPQVNWPLVQRRYWPHGDYAKQPYAQRVSIKPFEAVGYQAGQALDYDLALLTVQYERMSDTEPEDLVSESLEPTAEFMVQDHKRFTWGSASGDALEENEAPGKLVLGMNLIRTYYKVDIIPPQVLSCFGAVNAQAYTSAGLGLTFPKESLLYCPPMLERTLTTEGSDGWNITLKFQVKPDGWNRFWRAKTETWEKIWDTEKEEAHNSYPLKDFAALLQ